MSGINVLSLFDGMSGGRVALERAGVKVDSYCALEIDKYAINIAQKNYPDTVQLGSITDFKSFGGADVDLLIGGSPCQDLSFAGKGKGLAGERSGLFWEYVRIKNELQPKYFLLENVRMKQEYQDIISEALGVQPIMINSRLVSAQNRVRYYWTNIPFVGMPEDKGILLKDILEYDVSDTYDSPSNNYKGGNQLNANYKSQANTIHPLDGKVDTLCAGTHGYANGHVRKLSKLYPDRGFSEDGLCHVGDADLNGHDCLKRVYHPEGKAPTLNACTGGNREPKVLCGAQRGRYKKGKGKGTPTEQGVEVRHDEKTNALTSVQKDNLVVYNAEGEQVRYTLEDLAWRKLTPLECERLQTVPDNYTEGVSNTQRYKMLGNGFTVDVIAHILKGMDNELL